MDYEQALYWAKLIEHQDLKSLALEVSNRYVTGSEDKIPKDFKNSLEGTSQQQIIYSLLRTELMEQTQDPKYYNTITKELFDLRLRSDSLKLHDLSKIALRRHTLNTVYKINVLSALRHGVCDFEAYTNSDNPTDMFWLAYLKTAVAYREADLLIEDSLLTKDTLSNYKINLFNTLFESMHSNARNPMQCAFYYQNLGSYQARWLKRYDDAFNSFHNARYYYNSLNTDRARDKYGVTTFNIAMTFKDSNQCNEAIPYFLKDLDRKKVVKQKKNHLERLADCYESISQEITAKKFRNLATTIDEEGLTAKNDRLILEMQSNLLAKEFNQEKKELRAQNNELFQTNQTLYTNLWILIPVSIGIVLLLIFVFHWYKRYKNKSQVLEGEKSETLEKLNKIEEAVTTKYIVLSDKTKVYTGNLMYIQADDHYLHLYQWEGKTIIARETIANLRQKLPPNFIQCHRSYIVNKNYVLQGPVKKNIRLQDNTLIPVSRPNVGKFNK